MNHQAKDYTFWGLYNGGDEAEDTPLKSLAYLVSLVDSHENAIVDLDKAKFVIRWLFDVEEQVENASELLSRQETKYFPIKLHPQTPVMLTHRWSPISAMLENAWEPLVLTREPKRMACASGIWKPKVLKSYELYDACKTPNELFWHVLGKATDKAISRGQLVSVIAMPGWSYEDNFGRPSNLTLAQAQEADRVIWQRTPKQKSS